VSEEEDDRTEEQVVQDMSQEADRPMVVDPHDDRTFEFERTGLSRMRTTWSQEDADAMAGIHAVVDREIMVHFTEAFQIMNEIYDIVREPAVDTTTGEILTDQYGFTLWLRNETGAYIEDYSKLGIKEMEHFLFRISTRLFDWEQQAANLWGEAMFAKALWEQRLASSYAEARLAGARTVEDRTQAARLGAYDDRLFGVFRALISRKADGVVRSLTTLAQRMKDVLSA
jgi:hypothetical protein